MTLCPAASMVNAVGHIMEGICSFKEVGYAKTDGLLACCSVVKDVALYGNRRESIWADKE